MSNTLWNQHKVTPFDSSKNGISGISPNNLYISDLVINLVSRNLLKVPLTTALEEISVETLQ